MRRLAWVPAVVLIWSVRLSASPCVAGGTLASYESLGSTGCTIGPQTVNDFSFSVVSVTGSATALADTDITLTPTFGTDFFGVQFGSSGFITGAGTVEYLIGYTWDSIPIRGMEDALDPGNVDILTKGCVGAAFSGSSCSGTLVSVNVNATQLTDSVFFSPTRILGISNDISLGANGSFSSIENDAFVIPEPSSFLLTVMGALLLAASKRITSITG